MSLIHDILEQLGWVVKDTPIDVRAELDEIAQRTGKTNLNYSTSVVDLLELLGLPSTLSARMQLAADLHVDLRGAGSQEFNIRLHQALLDELEHNGGKVPPEWKQHIQA